VAYGIDERQSCEWKSKRGFAPLTYFFPLSFEGEGD